MSTHLAPLLVTFLLSFLSTGISDLAADRAALLRLSSAIGGITLRWNNSHPTPCSWEGVTCDPTANRVTTLRLPGAQLTGQIPPNTIGNLTQLRTLSLRLNYISGPLPSDLGSCTQLRNLYLQQNSFSGVIPATIFNLQNLVRLNLARNNLSGSISMLFSNLTRLRSLNLENNLLSGSLPELRLPNLSVFNVSNNNLTNSIPESLENFRADSFLGNSLCGFPLDPCGPYPST